MTARDPFELQRFVAAQAHGVHERALAEIRSGCKRSHWMWFEFPQLSGLGASATSKRFGISGLEEARAYLAHPVLGVRLHECAEALAALDAHYSAAGIFKSPDDMKLRSSLTLFAQVAAPGSIFERLLERYFDGRRDEATLDRLGLTGRLS